MAVQKHQNKKNVSPKDSRKNVHELNCNRKEN